MSGVVGYAPRAAAAPALFLILNATPQAQTAPQSLEPVVITASRFEQRLSDTLPHTSVVTRNDIERAQAPDVLTLIARAAGLEVAQLGGTGAQSGIFLRGAETRQVLVLIDGVPLNNLNFSTASLEQLTVGQIDRIEIVRGNVSALYGSQAVGGVIHVFTRGARSESGFGGQVRAAGGSRGTSEIASALDGAFERWRYALAASRFETDGETAIDPRKRPAANPDRDGYDNRSATASLGFRFAEGHDLTLRGFHSRGRLQYDSEFGPPTQADESEQMIESGNLALRNQFGVRWRSLLTVSRLRDTLDARVTAFPYFITSRGTNTAWQNDVTLNANWTATVALERLEQKIESDTTYGRSERTVDALRAGLAGAFGAHRLQLNLRHDDFSDFGTADTYYAGYGYSATETLRLFASASTAFNAPTFNDLFFPFGGNPALKPEKARSAELGAQLALQALRLRAALFSTRYRDLIGNDAAFNRANIGRASVEGAELSVETFVRTVRIVASLTAQDARNDVQDARLVRRARAFGNLQLSRAFGSFGVEANWRVTGDRLDRVSGQPRTLGGYGLVDLAARWRFDGHWAATLRAANLFDRAYENAWGYPGASRGAYAGVELRI
jgi:vitamin B12 transporter